MDSGYIRKSIYSLVSQVLLIALGMLSGIMIARVLGPDLKGKTAIITNALQMLFMIGGLGLGSSFAYFIARKKYDGSDILTFAITGSITLGTLALGLFYITMPMHRSLWSGIDRELLFYTNVLTFVYMLNSYLGRIISAYDRIYASNNTELIRSVINIAVLYFLLIVLKKSISGYVISLYVVAASQLLMYLYMLRNDFKLSFSIKYDIFKEGISYGIKSYALTLANFLNYRIDMFLLKYYKGDLDVGFYSLAVGMAELLWLVPNSTIAPLFNRIAGGETDSKSLLTVRTCRWSLYFLAIVAIMFIFCGRILIKLLYGAVYLPSYEPFIWLLPGICMFPIYKLLIVDLAARGMPGYGTVTSLIALITNILLNTILIPRFGAVGAAVASSISYSLMSIISVYFFIKETGFTVRRIFLAEKSEFNYLFTKLKLIKQVG